MGSTSQGKLSPIALPAILLICCGSVFILPPVQAQVPDPAELLREHALPLETEADLEPLLERARDRDLVLLGEASHGTLEFYEWRAAITRRLVEEGAGFVVVEGEWAAIRELDRYVRHHPGAAENAREAMDAFEAWPRWMWANTTFARLVEWLREHNQGLPEEERVALYGMDLNDPWGAVEPLLRLLTELDSPHRDPAEEAVACLRAHDRDPMAFVTGVLRGGPSCMDEAAALVGALEAEADGAPGDPARFSAAQKARVIAGAKDHFLALTEEGPHGWNLRVRHFHGTVQRLAEKRAGARGIVWAHNTHIGDARATAMAQQGEENLGQLVREGLGGEAVFLVGFSTHRGEVVAGAEWGAPEQVMRVPPAQDGSLEALLAEVAAAEDADAFLFFPNRAPLDEAFGAAWPHRAIGVVYDPEREAMLNYVATWLPGRYDALLFIEETRALEAVPAR